MRGFWNLFRKNVTEKFEALSEPTGFENQTDTTLTWADGSTTFTLAPASGSTFEFWLDSHKKVSAALTLVGDGTDFTIAQGLWFFYFDSTGTLVASQTPWNIETTCQVAILYWDAVNSKGLLGEERHSQAMPWRTHEYLHTTIGTRYGGAGLALSYPTNENTDMRVTAGSIWDEDIENDISQQTQCRVMYRTTAGGTTINWTAKQNYFWKSSGTPGSSGAVQYNATAATLAELGNAKYMAYWLVATNFADAPVVAIMGQVESGTLQGAKDDNDFESLVFDMPTVEWKALYRIVVKRNGDEVIVQDTQDLRLAASVGGSSYVASDHSNLTNLEADDHPQYVLKDLAEYIQFDTAATPDHAEGMIHWDDDEKTLAANTDDNDYHHLLGLALSARVKAGEDLDEGDIVYVSGTSGNRPEVMKAQADSESESKKVLGVAAHTTPSGQVCYVVRSGILPLDTSGRAVSEGDIFYLSATTPGDWTTTEPPSPNHSVRIGMCLIDSASGKLCINRAYTDINNLISGAGYPTVAPPKIGAKYIDTTNGRVWEAVAAVDAEDWRPTSAAYKDHGDTNSALTIYAYDASWHRIRVTGAFTLTIAGWRESGVPDSLTIELVNGASSAVTWATALKTSGAGGLSLTVAGTDVIEVSTRDGGTTQLGFQAAEDIS